MPAADTPTALPNVCLGETLARRKLLAVTTTLGAAATAGCTTVANFVADFVLADVNLLNSTDRTRTGALSITDPAGATVLGDDFVVEPDDDTGPGTTFDDVLTGAGSYTVAVELTAESSIRGETTHETTVEVSDPEAEHIVVALTPGIANDPIEVFVIETFTDIGDHIETIQPEARG